MNAHDDDENGACTDLIISHKLSDYLPVSGSIGLGSLLLGVFYMFNTFLTLYWIRTQKRNAEEGIEGAAKYVMFPLYMPFMWSSAVSDLLVGLTVLFISYDTYQTNSWPTSIAVSGMWAVQHWVIEGIACLLLQYGCGMQAVRKALVSSSVWALFTLLCYLFAARRGGDVSIVVTLLWNASLLVFYSTLWLAPDKFMFRRTALKRYSRFWSLFRLFSIIGLVLLEFNEAGLIGEDTSDCFYMVCTILVYVICKPYVVYYALLMDSIWWQGVYVRSPVAGSIVKSLYGAKGKPPKRKRRGEGGGAFTNSSQHPQDMFLSGDSDLVSPLHGIEVGFDEAQELANQVDTLRAEGQVKLLNFAYLSLNKSQLLGVGSFSKVYRGKYRGTPVAIKLIFTVDLNPEIIHRVCKEAQLLSQINHPNVVEIFGVSVFPPSVCLVLEICHYGSLSDVIRGKSSSSGKSGSTSRPPLPLTHADKMYLALGCARGLEALHSYSPTLCHRDVKSFNFLVDSQLNAKIADLELGGDDDEDPNYLSTAENKFVFGGGQMRRSPASSSSNLSLGDGSDSGRLSDCSGDNMVTQRTSFRSNRSGVSTKSMGSRHSGMKRVSRKLFGTQDKEEEFLCTWQAPEVMINAPHTQASDVYSLGLVFWEIISGLVPFENTLMQEDIRTLVLSGKRPAMPACADTRYVQLIKNCWKADWSGRPDIKSIVTTLTLCWEASVHRYLFATSYVCNLQDIRKHYETELERTSLASKHYNSSGRLTDDFLSRGSSLGRQPLSTAAAKASAYLQNEPRLQKLQTLTESTKSAFIIVTPDPPHLVLWISKYIPKILGFFHNDLVCGDLGCICGPSTNRFFLRALMQEGGEGKSGHRLITFYRRDKSQFINSLHAFPIFTQTSLPRDSVTSSQRSSTSTNINPFLESPPPAPMSPSGYSTSPLPEGGYMDAITRSLEVARRTTSEGKEYTPTKRISSISETTEPLHQPPLGAVVGHSVEGQKEQGVHSDQSTACVKTTNTLEEDYVTTPVDDPPKATSSPTNLESSGPSNKTRSLDLNPDLEIDGDAVEGRSKVAYVILQFSVVQDLRT